MLNMYKDLDSAQFCKKTLTLNMDYTNKNVFHFLKNTFSDFPQIFSQLKLFSQISWKDSEAAHHNICLRDKV